MSEVLEIAKLVVGGIVSVTTLYVGGSQFANRKKGKDKDASRDAHTAAIKAIAAQVKTDSEALVSKVELGMKEVSSQVAAYGQTLWTVQADVKVIRAELDVTKRELERERDRSDRMEARLKS